MGHRIVKRVPLDFDWPRDETWVGYLLPESLRLQQCRKCEGYGYSPEAQLIHDKWYGKVPFDPSETGSPRLTSRTPGVRAFAERQVNRAPEFYGRGERAIERAAQRLASLQNAQLGHHLAQEDVDALVAADRLWDLTHTWSRETRWKPRDPMPTITAEQVNTWSLSGFGHDSINCGIVVQARCEREGLPLCCPVCEGHGCVEKYPGQRAEADAWEPTEPPEGPGWQLWETTSEGSPVSPVFKSAEVLADWCEGNASIFAGERLTRAEWLASFLAGTTDVDSLMVVVKRD